MYNEAIKRLETAYEQLILSLYLRKKKSQMHMFNKTLQNTEWRSLKSDSRFGFNDSISINTGRQNFQIPQVLEIQMHKNSLKWGFFQRFNVLTYWQSATRFVLREPRYISTHVQYVQHFFEVHYQGSLTSKRVAHVRSRLTFPWYPQSAASQFFSIIALKINRYNSLVYTCFDLGSDILSFTSCLGHFYGRI